MERYTDEQVQSAEAEVANILPDEYLEKFLRPMQTLLNDTVGSALPAGMYKKGNDVFRVVISKSSGRPYAKRSLPQGGFDYVPGAIYNLQASDRMTYQEACARGLATGYCCVCAKELSDALSVTRGIGPVCEKRMYPSVTRSAAQKRNAEAKIKATKAA